MRLRFDQLGWHLQRQLAPVYLICGEEPWQLGEAVRMVRTCALGQGFEREVLDQEANFDWSALAAAADALSLFASRRLIELRLGAASLGQDGSAAGGGIALRAQAFDSDFHAIFDHVKITSLVAP